jgi:hypothetical protein
MKLPQHSRIDEIRAGMQQKAQRDDSYQKFIRQCPSIHPALVDHLDRAFAAPPVKPTDPNMANHLIYQAGIEKVKAYLRSQMQRQEAQAQKERQRI